MKVKKEKKEMKILMKNNKPLLKAHDLYKRFTGHDEYIEAYEARQKWHRDYISGIESARREGIEKGIKRGIKKGREEGRAEGLEKGIAKGRVEGIEKGIAKGLEKAARKMKKEGIPLKNIARITGLSLTRIEEL